MDYRREVDGLRSIAVLPVILFHAGITVFGGGFVGVDVFFVISGYLISTIILDEIDDGKFSIVTFYERRARRILPALFFVIVCSLPFAWFWLLPHHFNDFSESIVFVSLFSSNILFWQESGYFGGVNELKPLLHTWSLAVEEQYYIFFPIFAMMFWRRWKSFFLGLLVVVTLVSFAMAEWASINKPVAGFFLLPFRVWELFVGVFCTLYLRKYACNPLPRGIRNALSAAGLILVLLSIFFYDEHTPFPGFYALVPTLGTAFLICFGTSDTRVGKLLSAPVFVGTGLISYSAYLWHQPVFAFARHRFEGDLNILAMLSLSVVSMLLAYFSWKYVEAPFRNKKAISRESVFKFSFAGMAVALVLGVVMWQGDGISDRFDKRTIQVLQASEGGWQDINECAVTGVGVSKRVASACVGDGSIPYVYLIGDSHAASISKALREELSKEGIRLISWTENGCFPVPGTSRLPIVENGFHEKYKSEVYAFIEANPAPVIISTRWRLYLDGVRYNNEEGGVESGKNSQHYNVNNLDDDIYMYVESYLKEFSKGMPVVLVGQIPEAGWTVPDRIAKGIAFDNKGESDTLSTSYDVFLKKNMRVNELLDNLSDRAIVIRPDSLVCKDVTGRCDNQQKLNAFYRDNNHPSYVYAQKIARKVVSDMKADKGPRSDKLSLLFNDR
ncbi:acyltransferase [Spongiibacter sp. KMU-166]|uniref:Acyltransferase n=1 Tax=Spongiibacter thalassae TaxID=2721624 RepID=A0ABX1GHK3_9GAMM|nr:acyltransferase family protein [Spongiibacter thalassae]NKI18405.1 acyltransferase [Spongiibacter thalassae]